MTTPLTNQTLHSNLPALSLVRPPRAVRALVAVLAVLTLSIPLMMSIVPWQQNIAVSGRVTAFDPLNRMQTLPAPVTGRLTKVHVQEGSVVKAGDLLLEMTDQDPLYAQRLEQQVDFANDKLEAARDQLAFYNQQLANLEQGRTLAVSSAGFDLNVATEKVRAARQKQQAAEAKLVQKKADFERHERLFAKKVVSELDFQTAEAAYLSAQADLEGARAEVEQALNDERSKDAKVGQTSNDLQAKIESTKSLREDARAKLASAEKERNDALTAQGRQNNQIVVAPRDGRVFRIRAAAQADLLKQGDPLIDLVPDTEELAVELWARGIDAPLIEPGRKVRLQFEGWPAVQFSGWPSVAVGTFGGEVLLVDAQDDGNGRFRILVGVDPDNPDWPSRRYLRQGVRANGWVLLDEVRLGFEVWRQLNGFPPSTQQSPTPRGK
ncbi:MAG: HlyD family efflux transporter periplasmic adaptor subunit [Acidobacteriota bacterium]